MKNIARLFQPIKTTLANLITRAIVVSINSSDSIFIVETQVKGKPKPEKIPMMQHFGFASVPPKGSNLVRAHLSSNPDNPLIIASLHEASQPTDLVDGDSVLFDNHNQSIKLQVGGITLTSNLINLGVGGLPIARLGDLVQVDPNTGAGQITTGGVNKSK